MSLDYKKHLEELIATVIAEDASDLHLSEDRLPIIRVSGFLIPLVKESPLSKADMKGLLGELLDDQKQQLFLDNKEVDFAYDHKGVARFRGNAFMQLGKISIALRLIPKQIKTLDELKLPAILSTFATKRL